MVIDTSVLVTLLFGEEDAERFAEAIENDPMKSDLGLLWRNVLMSPAA